MKEYCPIYRICFLVRLPISNISGHEYENLYGIIWTNVYSTCADWITASPSASLCLADNLWSMRPIGCPISKLSLFSHLLSSSYQNMFHPGKLSRHSWISNFFSPFTPLSRYFSNPSFYTSPLSFCLLLCLIDIFPWNDYSPVNCLSLFKQINLLIELSFSWGHWTIRHWTWLNTPNQLNVLIRVGFHDVVTQPFNL